MGSLDMTDEPQQKEEVQANNEHVKGEVKQLSNDKRPSAKLQEKIRACASTFRSLNAIVNEVIEIGKSEGFTPKEIGNFIREEMLRSGLSRRTVTNYLPSELKAKPRGVQGAAAKTGTGIREIFSQNPKPNIPRRVRTPRPKNSPTETSVETSFSDTKHNDEKNINHKIVTQNISNHVVDDISSDRTNNLSTVDTIPLAANEPNKANLKTNVLNQEIALPCRESCRYISSQLNKGKNEFYISIKVNLDTGKIISVKIGRNSERETNSFRNIY